MIQSFLDSLEDRNRPLLGPNYWLLKKTGLLLPKNMLKRIYYIIIFGMMTFYVFTQYMEIYVIWPDLNLVLGNLSMSMMSSTIIAKANTFVIWQDSWRQVINYITEADKFERDNHDEAKRKIITTYTKYCRRLTYFYWALAFITSFALISMPLNRYASSSKYGEGIKNGTESFPHIFSSWMPFDKEHSPGCWITALWHIALLVYTTAIMAAYDTTVVVVLVCFGGKLDLLRIRCREMLGSLGKGISNENADAVIRQIHHIHVLLLKHSRLLNSILSPLMFFYVLVCSFMICASTFQLTTATDSATKLFKANYLIFGILQLFTFCWHTDDVVYKSHDVMLGPFESEWWAANLQQRKAVLLLQGQLRIPHMYTAGPFTGLTLATFVAILKGAYSYYTLLSK